MLPRVLIGPLLALMLLACAAPAANAAEVPSEWTWTDYGPSPPRRLLRVARPLRRGRPARDGPLLQARRRRRPRLVADPAIEFPEELDGVTCTTSFCLAVSNTREGSATFTSQVFRSTDGGATWSAGVALPPADAGPGGAKTRTAIALACAGDGSSCYAVGTGGGIWRSTDGGVSWTALDPPPGKAAYDHVDCPSAGVCVAAGGDDVGYSAVIEGTAVTPVELPAKFGKGVVALACDSATRCIGADGLGHYSLLDVAKKDWGAAKLFPKVKAVTRHLLSRGRQLRRPLRADRAAHHGARRRDLETAADRLARPRRADLHRHRLRRRRRTRELVHRLEIGFDWGRLNEVAKFESIQCGGDLVKSCVAGGEKDVGVSRSGGELWSEPLSGYSGLDVKAINCTGFSECLFLGKTMTLFTKDLVSFAGRHPTITDPKGTDAQTCITKEICVGINEGVTYTTLDGAVTDWNQNAFPEKATSVACVHGHTAPAQCLATTREFLALGTMTHDDGKIRWNWRYTDADPAAALEAVACSPEGQCTAVGGGGTVLTSQGHDLMHWNELTLPNKIAPGEKRPS